jgi:hypothetical protein
MNHAARHNRLNTQKTATSVVEETMKAAKSDTAAATATVEETFITGASFLITAITASSRGRALPNPVSSRVEADRISPATSPDQA